MMLYNYERIISQAIRDSLDNLGIELTYHDTDAAAEAVVAALRESNSLKPRSRT